MQKSFHGAAEVSLKEKIYPRFDAKMAAKPSLKLLRSKENKLDGVSFIYRNWLCDLDRADQFPGAEKVLSDF